MKSDQGPHGDNKGHRCRRSLCKIVQTHHQCPVRRVRQSLGPPDTNQGTLSNFQALPASVCLPPFQCCCAVTVNPADSLGTWTRPLSSNGMAAYLAPVWLDNARSSTTVTISRLGACQEKVDETTDPAKIQRSRQREPGCQPGQQRQKKPGRAVDSWGAHTPQAPTASAALCSPVLVPSCGVIHTLEVSFRGRGGWRWYLS
jgi:hypothetical protein